MNCVQEQICRTLQFFLSVSGFSFQDYCRVLTKCLDLPMASRAMNIPPPVNQSPNPGKVRKRAREVKMVLMSAITSLLWKFSLPLIHQFPLKSILLVPIYFWGGGGKGNGLKFPYLNYHVTALLLVLYLGPRTTENLQCNNALRWYLSGVIY